MKCCVLALDCVGTIAEDVKPGVAVFQTIQHGHGGNNDLLLRIADVFGHQPWASEMRKVERHDRRGHVTNVVASLIAPIWERYEPIGSGLRGGGAMSPSKNVT